MKHWWIFLWLEGCAVWDKMLLLPPHWRDGRAVECGGLENRWGSHLRGFESLSLRPNPADRKAGFFLWKGKRGKSVYLRAFPYSSSRNGSAPPEGAEKQIFDIFWDLKKTRNRVEHVYYPEKSWLKKQSNRCTNYVHQNRRSISPKWFVCITKNDS